VLGKIASVAAIGAAGLGYALWEAKQHTLRRVTVPILPAGDATLRVLHISDLHLTPGRRSTVEWVRGLAELRPDLVIATGDFLAHPEAVPTVAEALAPLLDVPGAFVLGSNDYYAPRLSNPLLYFAGPSAVHPDRPELPWGDLVAELSGSWANLSNAAVSVAVGSRVVSLRGVDDPHIERDDYSVVAGPWAADLRLGVLHAPYRRVLDAMTADGADLVLAGHTHGGQLRVPGFGALVTNCDLDRRRARGLSTYEGSALHVSAGLGTSPYAPIRFACPPEATLLTLTPGEAG
jgi:predicted MPP superfamily phosphohydrolase